MRVAVVGAGLAGLTAAGDLTAAGHKVTIFDKGRSPGGRMATRRIGNATIDHGAQFFTVRSDEFGARIAPHLESGLVYEWCRGFSTNGDGYPRYAVCGGMNMLTKSMAAGLDVRCNSMVFSISSGSTAATRGSGWQVTLDDGTALDADAVIVTCPLPQSYSLLMPAGVDLPEQLVRADYDRTIAALITLNGSPVVPEPGGIQNPNADLSFVVDNQRKGVSAAPALTVHANAEWSLGHWDDPLADLATALTSAAADFIGAADVVELQVKKWRFATPRSVWDDPCWIEPHTAGSLIVAGDAFAGPKVEGAVRSGAAAATALLAN
ncbi:MAG: FAD-dependent oxidoreductase [Ilumatobacteraceae bacterium]